MVTGYERYSKHAVRRSLRLKRESFNAAQFDNAESEHWREGIVEWLEEALNTRAARQPALYLSTLDALSAALNQLPVDTANFQQFIAYRQHDGHVFKQLEHALRALPLPAPRDLKASYVELLDREVSARNKRLSELEQRISETEKVLVLAELEKVTTDVQALRTEIQTEREVIAAVSQSAESEMLDAWNEALDAWDKDREATELEHDTQALARIATLSATTKAGEALAERAAGDLSAADWYARAKRERSAARWIRSGAWAAFLFAGDVGFYIVNEAIIKNFDISVGGGVLRASIAVVIGAFGALLLREAGRHFREADTAEDVALSLRALAPFYANPDEGIRLTARVQLGDALLVKNVLSVVPHMVV